MGEKRCIRNLKDIVHSLQKVADTNTGGSASSSDLDNSNGYGTFIDIYPYLIKKNLLATRTPFYGWAKLCRLISHIIYEFGRDFLPILGIKPHTKLTGRRYR